MVTDGLTEAGYFGPDAFGYRFLRRVEERAGDSVRDLGEAILNDWRTHPRSHRYADDVSLIIAASPHAE
jgi:serine phosphatase RsbU (regulator of sigma subunit)